MNTHAVQAKLLLRHYLSLAVGSSYNGDDASQINSIVDHIIAAVVEELQAQPAPALVQPSMFPAGEDSPLFTQPGDAPDEPEPETRIEFAYYKLDPALVDVVADCIDYAWPKGTIAGCWAHLDKLLARGTLTQEDYDEIKAAGDFIIAD